MHFRKKITIHSIDKYAVKKGSQMIYYINMHFRKKR